MVDVIFWGRLHVRFNKPLTQKAFVQAKFWRGSTKGEANFQRWIFNPQRLGQTKSVSCLTQHKSTVFLYHVNTSSWSQRRKWSRGPPDWLSYSVKGAVKRSMFLACACLYDASRKHCLYDFPFCEFSGTDFMKSKLRALNESEVVRPECFLWFFGFFLFYWRMNVVVFKLWLRSWTWNWFDLYVTLVSCV